MLPNELPLPIVQVIQSVVPDFKGDGSEPLTKYAIDSFDFMTLRSLLEEELRIRFTDDEWIAVKKFSDLSKKIGSHDKVDEDSETVALERDYLLNMPQMNVSGLSEYWYLKEIGDMHWRMIAACLNVPSDQILDKEGQRLYSTFVRIKYSSSHSFINFKENDQMNLRCEMSRFGNFFLSRNKLKSGDKVVQAELVTSFVARGKGNTDLYKSTPAEEVKLKVKNHSAIPDLIDRYHVIRKEQSTTYDIDGITFDLKVNAIFEEEYKLDPYHDLNGVGLLYFASYPHIFDYCERSFMNNKNPDKEWSFDSAIQSRDIFYLGNVDLKDGITYRLLGYIERNNIAYFAAELVRKSDQKRLSLSITRKGIAR